MTAQFITAADGSRLAILPESEYRALIAAAEEATDIADIREFERKLAAGDEELIPADVANRLIEGVNPVRVWREYRGFSAKQLSEAAGIARPYLSQMENGKRAGTVDTMRKIADVLGVTIDDLV